MIQNMKVTKDWEASVDLGHSARLTLRHVKTQETFLLHLTESGFDVVNQWTEDSSENFKTLLNVNVGKIR